MPFRFACECRTQVNDLISDEFFYRCFANVLSASLEDLCDVCCKKNIWVQISVKILEGGNYSEHLLISDAILVGFKWANSSVVSTVSMSSRSCPNSRVANFAVYTDGFGSQIRTRSFFETNTLLPACNGIISSATPIESETK